MARSPDMTNVLDIGADEFRRLAGKLSIGELAFVSVEGLTIYLFLNDDGPTDETLLSPIFFALSKYYYIGISDLRSDWRESADFSLGAVKDSRLKLMLEYIFDLAISYYGQPVNSSIRDEKTWQFRKILEILQESEIILVDLRPAPVKWLETPIRRLLAKRHLEWSLGDNALSEPMFSFSFTGLPPAAEKIGWLSIRGRTSVALRGLEIYLAQNPSSQAKRINEILPALWADLSAEQFDYRWGERRAVVDELGLEHTILGKIFFCVLNIIGAHYYTAVSRETENDSQQSLKILFFLLQKNGIVLKNIDGVLNLAPVRRIYPIGEMTWGEPLTRDRVVPLIEYESQ